MQTIKFYTLGCKVNQYETQSLRERFINSGFRETDNGQKAEVYLINTCTVTQRADSESLNLIRRAKRENPKAKIIVTGCLTELDTAKIKKTGSVNLIVKNKDKNRIPGLLNGQNGLNDIGISYFKGHTRAFLKIQDGCNNFCSYCKVPLVRGKSRSRPLNEVLEEAKRLVQNGFKEIVLTGICLGAYGQDLRPKLNLVNVIAALESIDGVLRIRLSSIEAGDLTDEIIKKLSQTLPDRQAGKKLCRHLHIPIQSGDDEILKKMNRKYSRSDYVNLIKKIKIQVPGIAITTDILVGFPGETEINFQNTIDLVKEISPLKVHIFPYSAREGTFAAKAFQHKIRPSIIRERILGLKRIAEAAAADYRKQFLNQTLAVLIEGRAKEDPNFFAGYTDNYIKVLVRSNRSLENQLIPLKLKKISHNFVLAYLV